MRVVERREQRAGRAEGERVEFVEGGVRGGGQVGTAERRCGGPADGHVEGERVEPAAGTGLVNAAEQRVRAELVADAGPVIAEWRAEGGLRGGPADGRVEGERVEPAAGTGLVNAAEQRVRAELVADAGPVIAEWRAEGGLRGGPADGRVEGERVELGVGAGRGGGPVSAVERQVRERVAEWERRLGDPDDPGNPAGFRALLAADERAELAEGAVAVLHEGGFGAELVPVALGGRLERADVLARVLRPVFRRDVSLGFGHGITSLFAAAPVWASGSPAQRRRIAELLLAGRSVAIAHHALAHANALWQGEFTAASEGEGYLLRGRKDVVINADRAGAVVVFARAGEAGGSHSVLLVDPAEAGGTLTVLPRRISTGMRGCRFAGLEFTDLPVSGEARVGLPGEGVRLALRTFQLNRTLIPAVLLAGADTVLRAAARAAGRPRHGALLAGVFADLLLCDAMATAVLRALHLVPDSAHLGAAAVKYLVPDLLRDDVEELSAVLGASGYDRAGGPGSLQKLLRDMPAASLGHVGTAACQAVLIPQLPVLARESWLRAAEPPAALYAFEQPLPPLDLGALAVAGGSDVLIATLAGAAARLRADPPAGPDGRVAAELAGVLTGELAALRERALALPADSAAALASPSWCALVERYALLAAAGAALGGWEARRGGGGFLADPAWLVLALSRLARRLGLPVAQPPADCVRRVHAEVLARLAGGRSLDLYDTPLAEGGSR
ncbi:acyl-CoA dehydrogenase family protein [Kitasatospora sp. NPDC059673]|uniref:acyl-CoA dehydrogenase family protein n=1 Tax=Kitasatospora sp. NPDC059673 TaxID=3346901 RepID=UPI0036B6DCFA